MDLTLLNKGDYFIIDDGKKYDNVIKIDNISVQYTGTTPIIEFRWSSTGDFYSGWILYTIENTNPLEFNPNEPFYIQYRLTNPDNSEIKISCIDINFTKKVNTNYLNELITLSTTSGTLNCQSGVNVGFINSDNMCFSPYANMSGLICIQNQLSASVNQLFGIDINYFRAVPVESSKDIVFNEWTLYGVEHHKCIKIMIEDYPEMRPEYNPFGVTFEVPFQIEIDKSYWDSIFGADTMPQKRDILHIPMLNSIWEISSSYTKRTIMMLPTHYVISLVKYQPKSNVYKTPTIEDFLSEGAKSYESLHSADLDIEELETAKPLQYDIHTGNTQRRTPNDRNRAAIHKSLIVDKCDLWNCDLLLSERHYDMCSTYPDTAVEYKNEATLQNLNHLSYAAWFKELNIHRIPQNLYKTYNVASFVMLGNELTITFNANHPFKLGDWVEMYRLPSINILGKVSIINSLTTVTLTIPDEILSYMNSLNPVWTGLNGGFKANLSIPRNLIYGHDGTNGMIINTHVSKYIQVILNDKEYFFVLDNKLEKDWYGIVVNVSKQFKQIEINIFKRESSSTSPTEVCNSDLCLRYNFIKHNIDSFDFDTDSHWKIQGSFISLTNVRLFSKPIPIESQSNILNQQIIEDDEYLLIFDNAYDVIGLPYIANPK